MNGQDHQKKPRPVPEEALKCPRCESTNTKFCYYNNYSLSQPRYFCKSCRRFWTKGGTLMNVPVGGGCRRNKRSSTSSASSCKNIIKTFHDETLNIPLITGLPSLGYDAVDLNLAFASGGPSEVSIFGNSMGLFGGHNGNFSSGLGYGFLSLMGGGDDHHRRHDNDTTSTAMPFEESNEKREVSTSGNNENPNKVLWGFPWQMTVGVSSGGGGGGGGATEIDGGRESWNGLSSSWHALLNSPLM